MRHPEARDNDLDAHRRNKVLPLSPERHQKLSALGFLGLTAGTPVTLARWDPAAGVWLAVVQTTVATGAQLRIFVDQRVGARSRAFVQLLTTRQGSDVCTGMPLVWSDVSNRAVSMVGVGPVNKPSHPLTRPIEPARDQQRERQFEVSGDERHQLLDEPKSLLTM